jgi:hypothetical protein
MFAAGAVIGSAVTWKVVKTKYERIVQEEIESVKEVFAEQLMNRQEQDDCDIADESNEHVSQTKQIDWSELEDLDDNQEEESDGLNDYERLLNRYNEEKGGAEDMAKRPYVISPYDFGELDDYHQIELTYYADGTLEDDEYNVVTDVDELVGQTSLYTFGEYEDDAVFVRNEELRTDFQILKDYRTYAEARSAGPGQVDDE